MKHAIAIVVVGIAAYVLGIRRGKDEMIVSIAKAVLDKEIEEHKEETKIEE